jgi:hypothetical protein
MWFCREIQGSRSSSNERYMVGEPVFLGKEEFHHLRLLLETKHPVFCLQGLSPGWMCWLLGGLELWAQPLQIMWYPQPSHQHREVNFQVEPESTETCPLEVHLSVCLLLGVYESLAFRPSESQFPQPTPHSKEADFWAGNLCPPLGTAFHSVLAATLIWGLQAPTLWIMCLPQTPLYNVNWCVGLENT